VWAPAIPLAFVLAATPASESTRTAATKPNEASEARRTLRWGLALGFAARGAIGAGTRPDGQPTEEYAGGDLGLAVEAFTLRWRWLEAAPYFAIRLAGGVNASRFEPALERINEAGDPDAPELELGGSEDLEVGLGFRAFPFRWGGFEPYVGVFGAYARSVVDIAPVEGGGSPFDALPVERHAREALALSGVLGARFGWSFEALSAPRVFVAAELRATHNVWLGLEGPFEDVAGPEDLNLDHVCGTFWLGYQL